MIPSLLQVSASQGCLGILKFEFLPWGSWNSCSLQQPYSHWDFSVQLHSPFGISKYWGPLTSWMIPARLRRLGCSKSETRIQKWHLFPKKIHKCTSNQWEIFRIQYMEVRKRTICLAIFCGDIPWKIGLTYSRYLQFRFLKWPVIKANLMPQKQRHFKLELFLPNPNVHAAYSLGSLTMTPGTGRHHLSQRRRMKKGRSQRRPATALPWPRSPLMSWVYGFVWKCWVNIPNEIAI